jgi:hypothetical protein
MEAVAHRGVERDRMMAPDALRKLTEDQQSGYGRDEARGDRRFLFFPVFTLPVRLRRVRFV